MQLSTNSETEILKRERFYVIILAAIQFVHILDFVVMMPLGPHFMRVFSISPVKFSTLVSAYTFSAGIIGFFGAFYADHFDRKKFLLFNFTGFIIGTLMCAISPNFTSLLVARIIAGAFGGILNASVLSLIIDLIPFKRRGNAMGVVMSAFSVSSIIGIPIGLYIANEYNWHGTFYFICLIGVIFWVASFIYLPSVKVNKVPESFKENLKKFKSIIVQKDYAESFLLASILAFGVFTIVPFISAYVVRNVGVKETDLPLMYLIGGIFTIITARIIGKTSDKFGSYTIFRNVALLAILPMFALTNLPHVPLWVATVVTTLFTALGSGRFIPAMTLVSAVIKPEERGTFMSLLNAARQFSSGASSQVAGLIIGATASGELTNYHVVGYIGIFSTMVAIYIALRIRKKFNLK